MKLGGDASVAAGPVGRTTSAETDIVMNAEMLSWSRAKGIFAGISLTGSTIRSDEVANKNLYGKELDAKQFKNYKGSAYGVENVKRALLQIVGDDVTVIREPLRRSARRPRRIGIRRSRRRRLPTLKGIAFRFRPVGAWSMIRKCICTRSRELSDFNEVGSRSGPQQSKARRLC